MFDVTLTLEDGGEPFTLQLASQAQVDRLIAAADRSSQALAEARKERDKCEALAHRACDAAEAIKAAHPKPAAAPPAYPCAKFHFAAGAAKDVRFASVEDRNTALAWIKEQVDGLKGSMVEARVSYGNGIAKTVRFMSREDRDAVIEWIAQNVPKSTAPTPVAIVSMPDRVTETTVARDDSGNITTTTQTQRDAQQAE